MLNDLRHAIRSLARAPGFTLAVVLTLALGSGANAAILSMFNQALLHALPVPRPEELVNLSSPGPKAGRVSTYGTDRPEDVFSYPLFHDLERAQNAFAGIAAHGRFNAHIAYRGQASSETGQLVSGEYFDVLAMAPAAGRLLGPEDEQASGNNVAVLSHAYWMSRFSGDSNAVNEHILVNGQVFTVVGVTSAAWISTTLEDEPSVYVPLSTARLMMPGWDGFENRKDHWLDLFARLKPGMSREAAERAMSGPFAALLKDVDFPAQRSGLGDRDRQQFAQRRLVLEPGKQGQRPERGEVRSVFRLLFAVTGVVLLIACANVSSLLLARAASRSTEVSVRLALGASRGQLVRQMLMESCVLAVMGTFGGLVLSVWMLGAFRAAMPGQMTQYLRFEFDSTIFFATVVVSGGIALLIGLYPALHGTRGDLVSSLRGRGMSSGTRSASGFRTGLATLQIAMAMALLVVAGLFVESLFNVSRVELGIQPENLTTFRLSPELSGYTPERARTLADRINQELAALPGVQSVSASTIALLAGDGGGSNVTVDAFGVRSESGQPVMRANVGANYFGTVGIPLVAGREFNEADVLDAPKVAIVNQAFARRYIAGANPIGGRMAEGSGSIQLDIEIIGVVRDARSSQIKVPPPPQYYLPYRQRPRFGALNFYVRSTQPAGQLVTMIPGAVRRVDATLPVENLRTMEDQLTSTQGKDRIVTALSVGFGALAMLLTAIGLYGVLSYMVAQRKSEIGLRMALGADGRSIGTLILARMGRMTAVGATLGLFAALGLTQLAQSQLFGVQKAPPLLLLAAATCTSLVTFAASLIPAWRAARVDPSTALRAE